MYERFTDDARKVMQRANQEVQRFNHEYIGTEHILLALIKTGGGVADVLANLSVDPRRVRLAVKKLMTSGADKATIDKAPLTPCARHAMEYAMEEACRHDYVGADHILLGLLREEEGVAAQVLVNLGLTLEAVREQVRAPSPSPRRVADSAAKFADHPLVRSYRETIEALTKEKEEYVDNHEFEKAAAKRDEADEAREATGPIDPNA